MFHITRDRSRHLSIFLTMTAGFTVCSADDEAKVSDACHGPPVFNQTHNILECDKGTQICITEVRYYQWHQKDQVCPRQIPSTVPDRCCRHKSERCSRIGGVNHRQELQRNCTGQSHCDLHSSDSESIAPPCVLDPQISRYSSVRSITYTCATSGTICPPDAKTTTTTGRTKEASSTKTSASSLTSRGSTGSPATSSEIPSPNDGRVLGGTTNDMAHSIGETTDIGAVVGGVIGGLVICALIVALLVFLWKTRCPEKPRVPQTDNRGDDVTEVRIYCQPNAPYERDDNNTPWDRGAETNVSDLYSKVNKTRRALDSSGDAAFSVGAAVSATNHHGNYDRLQGEAAHFTVHGDYDHVIRHSHGENSSEDVTGRVTSNDDVDMAYDRLHRDRAVPARTETEVDPYDVLNRANTRAT